MIYKIGHELDTLDNYDISVTSARMRILVNGLNPLIKETIIDFDSGEESLLTLEYEGLKNHCSSCHRLSHLDEDCPSKIPTVEVISPLSPVERQQPDLAGPSLVRVENTHHDYFEKRTDMATLDVVRGRMQPQKHQNERQPFSSRLDRHGNPFGERVTLASSLARPLKNKITPSSDSYVPRSVDHRGNRSCHNLPQNSTADKRRSRQQGVGSSDSSHQRNLSPQRAQNPLVGRNKRPLGTAADNIHNGGDYRGIDVRRHSTQQDNASPSYTRHRNYQRSSSSRQRRSPTRRSPTLLGDASPVTSTNAIEDRHTETRAAANHAAASHASLGARPPLERNLNASDFLPPPPSLPTTEQVMEQLVEATYQYTNRPNPIEREARRQRVLETNSQGIMEETAARIIEAERAAIIASSPAQQLVCFRPEPGFNQSVEVDISFQNTGGEESQDLAQANHLPTRTTRPPRPKKMVPHRKDSGEPISGNTTSPWHKVPLRSANHQIPIAQGLSCKRQGGGRSGPWAHHKHKKITLPHKDNGHN